MNDLKDAIQILLDAANELEARNVRLLPTSLRIVARRIESLTQAGLSLVA